MMGQKQPPPRNLHIDPDEDGELIELLEERFRLRISDEDLASAVTLSDLYEAICRKLPPPGRGEKSGIVRRRLAGCSIVSDADVRNLDAEQSSPKVRRRRLEDQTGLTLPFLTKSSLWATLTALLPLIAFIVGPAYFDGIFAGIVTVASTGFGILLWRLALIVDSEIWVSTFTLDALIAKAVEANFGRLVALGAGWSEREVWQVLVSTAAEFTNVPAEDMRRETLLM